MAAPREVWRIWLRDGSTMHSVIWERRHKTAVVWYLDDEVEGAEEFVDPAEAEEWASSLQSELLGPTGHRIGVE